MYLTIKNQAKIRACSILARSLFWVSVLAIDKSLSWRAEEGKEIKEMAFGSRVV